MNVTLSVRAALILLLMPFSKVAFGQAGKPRELAAKSGSGMGTITAVDAKGGTVTVQHGAIPAMGWPAMTITFGHPRRHCSGGCGQGSSHDWFVRMAANASLARTGRGQ